MLVDGGGDGDGGAVVTGGGLGGSGCQVGLLGGEPVIGLLSVGDDRSFSFQDVRRHQGDEAGVLLVRCSCRGVLVVAEQPVDGRVTVGLALGSGAGAGMFGDKVVEAVAAAVGFSEKVVFEQGLQAAAGDRQGGVIEGSGGVGVEIAAGVQGEAAEQSLPIGGQVAIGQI